MQRALKVAVATMTAGALAACVSARAADAPDPFTLGIEIGRYAYMLTQTADLAPSAQDQTPAPDIQRAALNAQLVETAFTLNAQRARLCRDGFRPDLTCVMPYLPVWLGAPPGPAPETAVLQARADELGGQVMAIWEAVCAAAPKNPEEPLGPCPIE